MNMIKLLSALTLFISLSVCTPVVASTDSDSGRFSTHFDPRRDSGADLKAAIQMAQKTNRRILMDVGGDWCIWCHRLDSLFINNSDIRALLRKNYVVVKINYSRENKNEAFLAQYPKIEGYPHIFILDKNGQLLHSQNTGELETGSRHDPGEVRTFLQKWMLPK
jgi:thioredoxin-related protein